MTGNVPIDTLAENLLSLFPLFHGKIFRRYPEISGMQLAGYRALGTLTKCGPLPASELARKLYISRPYITRLVDSLITDHLVERMPDEKDRRITRIRITAEGIRRLKNMGTIFHDDVVEFLKGLDEEELAELNECLKCVNRILVKQ
ncbi:DNA-binding MarR family transcriptional regulator [Methanolinea mesophila]|uniref:MarR family winged helix-turn-helix transcriptional regulator n=1 Tax=Methanolinea mesophila TaxID=547055 RepID=UPI001AE2009C|nr:MarR family transcriptional regulator [Methanolinea mesophila]MBP1929795.1 DNA-binding MarR family transcriptional regulator [Methanolinea mesophila]